jgi:hypothetical protein
MVANLELDTKCYYHVSLLLLLPIHSLCLRLTARPPMCCTQPTIWCCQNCKIVRNSGRVSPKTMFQSCALLQRLGPVCTGLSEVCKKLVRNLAELDPGPGPRYGAVRIVRLSEIAGESLARLHSSLAPCCSGWAQCARGCQKSVRNLSETWHQGRSCSCCAAISSACCFFLW